MKYNMAIPYFSSEDIDEILGMYRSILSGEGLMSMGRYVQEFEQKFSSYIAQNILLRPTPVRLSSKLHYPLLIFSKMMK
jgi:hypothetical protein